MEKVKKVKLLKFMIILFIFVMSIYIRRSFLPIKTGDYDYFLKRWFDTIKENGGIFALKMSIGDYNLPYLQILAILTYLPINSLISIKMVSIIFDYLGAIFCGLIVYQFTKNKDLAIIDFAITILLPTVLLNSSAWGQCDFIYTSFIILSLLFLFKDKFIKSFIFLGIAFAFKLQTIFVLPVFILYYLSERKFPIYLFLIIPIVDLVLCIPSIIVGRPIIDVIKVYLIQAGENQQFISMEFPGIYNLFYSGENGLITIPNIYCLVLGLLITGGVFFAFAVLVFFKKIKFSKKLLLEFSVWSVMICTYFLPRMHDRYMFSADVLSVVCALIDKKKWYLPVGVNISSACMYISVFNLQKTNLEMKIVSIFLGIILIKYTIDLFEELIGTKKLNKGDTVVK